MRITLIIFCCFLFMACGSQEVVSPKDFNTSLSAQEVYDKGAVLFKNNCSVCHSLDNNLPTGMAPVLENIKKNWPQYEKLAAYIKNAPEQMQETARARAVYASWKEKAQMPAFAALSGEEIDCIIKFLYKETY